MNHDAPQRPRRSLRRQLLQAFATVLSLSLLAGIFGVWSLRRVGADLQSVGHDHELTQILLAIKQESSAVRRDVLLHLLAEEDQSRASLDARIVATDARLLDTFEDLLLAQNLDVPEANSLIQLWEKYASRRDTLILPQSRAGKTRGALDAATGPAAEAHQGFDDELDLIASQASTRALTRTLSAESEVRANSAVLPLLVGLSIFLGLFLARKFTKRLVGNLAMVSEAATAMKDGDLTRRAGLDVDDEVGDLSDDFDAMADQILGLIERQQEQTARLGTAISEVNDFAASVATGDLTHRLGKRDDVDIDLMYSSLDHMVGDLRTLAGQLGSTTNDLTATTTEMLAVISQNSGAAAEQASAIAEVTSTVEELRASSEQSADRATSLVETAVTSAEIGVTGASEVEHLVQDMEQIATTVASLAADIVGLSSQMHQATEIVETVGALADRSNLLALNAGIEAAKAGEHGRGFGVVADEVRSLAEQSREATDEVRSILGNIGRAADATVLATESSTRVIDAGRIRVRKTGDVIDSLAEAVGRVSSSAHVIAGAAREQSVGLDQIGRAMSEINGATSHVAASAEQAQRAMIGLDVMASELRTIVRQYRIDETVEADQPHSR